MALQVINILQDALSLIGANAADEPATNSDIQLALRTANNMLDRFSAQRLFLRATTQLSFNLVAGQSSYIIGPTGADIISTKPLRIRTGFFTYPGGTNTPLDVITQEEYDNLSDATISSGPPMYVCYNPGAAQQSSQSGTLYVYLVPDSNYPVLLECDLYLTEFVNATDTLTFEPAYSEALVYNLAVRLFRHFHDPKLPIPQDLVALAAGSLNTLRALNGVRIQSGMDLPGRNGVYNIYTDSP